MNIRRDEVAVSENRQRRDHDAAKHQELVSSIQTTGLLHAPVLRLDGEKIVLVAGERRLRAIDEIWELGGTFLYNGEVYSGPLLPYVTLGELAPLEAEEAELEENIRRVDLSWTERALVEARLLALRQAQAIALRQPVPQAREVAEELRGADTDRAGNAVAQSIILSRNLHRPEIKAAKSHKEAWKTLKRVEEADRNRELATKLGPEYLASKHQVHHAEAIEWMRKCPSGVFDVILTDPPYGMGADEFGDSGGKTGGGSGEHGYDDSEDSFWNLIALFVGESVRLTKPDAHLYLFCDFDKFTTLRNAFEAAGWKVFRTPLIWFKPSAYRAPWPEQGPQRKYELILYAVKGGLKCTKLGGDVIQCAPDENLGHAAQKPVELFQELLSRSVRPGMTVFDPFCGTGPIFPAAHALSAVAVGVEQDAGPYAIAATRMGNLKGEKK